MKSVLALSAVGAVFIVGTIVGGLGFQLYDLHHGGGHVERFDHDEAHQSLAELLDLSEDQRTEVHRILEQAHHESRALHERLLPQVDEHVRHIHEQVNEVLEPHQQRVFAELLERHQRQMQQMFLAGPTLHRDGHEASGGHGPHGEHGD